MTAKRTPDWRLTLPTWIADEILHVGAAQVIEALTAHVALPDDHHDIRKVSRALVRLEAVAWATWSSNALIQILSGEPVPIRPDEDRLKITVGRVPIDVREALQARAEALGFRHTVYAAGVVLMSEAKRVSALIRKKRKA